MIIEDIHKDIGTARDNRNTPIHDWYRFTAGFSFKLVEKIILEEKLNQKDRIYESFAGCGTTLVSAQKNDIKAVGNEGQELLFDVIKAKLNWNIDFEITNDVISNIEKEINSNHYKTSYHKLLVSLYNDDNLRQLYFIRDFLDNNDLPEKEYLFLKLALTQTLHKVSIHPIAIPYISRTKTLSNALSAFEMFEQTLQKMTKDLGTTDKKEKTSQIYFQDSRERNTAIEDNSCTICITSPPYLNNLDYGEVSKVCSHFYGITNDWGEITEKVRKKLVTGATTHYKKREFDVDLWKQQDFYLQNKILVDNLMPDINKIEIESKKRKGKKSFHILALYYFEDMYKVLIEMRRVLKAGSKAYLVLGDSAPYGVFIDTTKLLGEIALSVGFNNYKIIKIRDRGTKWKSLRFRHSLQLSENILILE